MEVDFPLKKRYVSVRVDLDLERVLREARKKLAMKEKEKISMRKTSRIIAKKIKEGNLIDFWFG